MTQGWYPLPTGFLDECPLKKKPRNSKTNQQKKVPMQKVKFIKTNDFKK
jgi:hypothetical protein